MGEDYIIVNYNGEQKKVKILEIFEVIGYHNKKYVLYVFPEQENKDDEKVAVQVSILVQEGNHYSLLNIEDDQEFEDVSKAISEMYEDEEDLA